MMPEDGAWRRRRTGRSYDPSDRPDLSIRHPASAIVSDDREGGLTPPGPGCTIPNGGTILPFLGGRASRPPSHPSKGFYPFPCSRTRPLHISRSRESTTSRRRERSPITTTPTKK